MPRKLLFSPLLIILFQNLVDRAIPWLESDPAWNYFDETSPWDWGSSYNQIPAGSPQSHVTGIELGLTSSNAIYSVKILVSNATGTAQPWMGCHALSGDKRTLDTYERVKIIEAWRNDVDLMWYRLKITLHSLAIVEYDATPSGGANTLHTFTVPDGEEFTGFYMEGYPITNCVVSQISLETRPLSTSSCCVFLDLSSFNGTSQNVFTDDTKTVQFTRRPWECGTATFEYQVTFTLSQTTTGSGSATPPNLNLITLSVPTVPSIVFAQSLSPADALNYTITVLARKYGSTTPWTHPLGSATATYSYFIPCEHTTITASTLTNMFNSVRRQNTPGGTSFFASQTASATDSASVNHATPFYCGQYQYSISSSATSGNAALNSTELSIDPTTGEIKLFSDNSQTVGTHSATVTIGLANFANVGHANFQITIDACILTANNMNTLSTQLYSIADPMATFSITATQVPPCEYSQHFTTSPYYPFLATSVTDSTIDFQVFTNNVLDEGDHIVVVTSTLTNYASSSQINPIYSTFTAIVHNPCTSTSIQTDPTTVANLVAFAGYGVESKEKYSIVDTISKRYPLGPDYGDLCGEKTLAFTINGTSTAFLSVDDLGLIHFNHPANTTDYGVGLVAFQATMETYPSIQSSIISFTVTILGSVVPTIPHKQYTQGSAPLTIIYDKFLVLPQGYDAGPSSIEVFLFTGVTLPERIDFECGYLTKASDLDWIFLDQTIDTITVQTSNKDYVGEHIIVLVQFFEDFLGVNPYTSFTIEIIDEVKKYEIQKPPYFKHELSTQTVTQCSKIDAQLWYFELPEIIDPEDSPVRLKVQFDENFFVFDDIQRKMTQIKVVETSTNQTVKFELTNAFNISAVYSMKVQFVCSVKHTVASYIPPKPKISESKVLIQYPARIASISRGGLVDVRFYLNVLVPNFENQTDQSGADGKRQLNQSELGLTPEHYITHDVLSIQLQTKFTLKNVDWQCTGFSNQSIHLQLNFTDPMQISQDHQDMLVVKFIQTNLFVLSARSEYLFQNESSKTLVYNIPPQLPSNTTAAFFAQMSTSVQQVGVTVIAITLIIQLVAKKVITSMWLYYCALQIVILLVQHSNMFAPASVDLIIDAVSGIINLSSLDKQQLASKLHLGAITNSAVFQSLDGVALASIGIFVLVLLLGVSIVISRQIPKVHSIFMKIKTSIFWNFLIRYFQASFIGFNFAAVTAVMKSSGGLKDVAISVLILIVQYAVVCYVAFFLLRTGQIQLNNSSTRQRVGNLYFNLDTRERQKLLFGIIFFVQRCLLVLLLALRYNFSIQWHLCQFVLLFNTAYVLTAKPYLDPENATLDYINCIFLLVICVLISTYSAWNTNIYDRFFYGILFDAMVGLQFLVNMVYISKQVINSLMLTAKQKHFRWKERRRKSAVRALKARQAAEHAQEVASLQEKINTLAQLKSQAAKLRNESLQRLQVKSAQSGKFFEQALTVDAKKALEQIDEISEISSEKDYNSFDRNSTPDQRWRPPTPGHTSSRVGYGLQSSRKNQEKSQNDIQLLSANNVSKPNETFDDFMQHHAARGAEGITHQGMQTLLQNQTLARSRHTSGQTIQRSQLFDKWSQKANQRKDFQMKSTDSYREPPAKQTKMTGNSERHASQNLNMDQQQRSHFINAKTKKSPSFTFVQWKVSPASFSLKVPVNRVKLDFLGSERQFLERASANYFAGDSRGVRRYKQGEKEFVWVEDVWPFYRQSIEHNYSGPVISEQQHREYVKVHLYKEWIKDHPRMPFLPLLVSVELYLEICREIQPHVLQYLADRRMQHH